MPEPRFDQYEFRAREHNSYLPIWERFFGSKKVNGIDLAYDEAIKFNEMVDQLVVEGKTSSYQGASDVLDKQETDEHKKNYGHWGRNEKYVIFDEEIARAASLKFAEFINSNEFEKASHTYEILPGWKTSFKSPGRKEVERDLGSDPLGGRQAGELDWKTEILPYTLPILYKYQRDILNEKIKKLESVNDQQKIDSIKSIFKSVLDETAYRSKFPEQAS